MTMIPPTNTTAKNCCSMRREIDKAVKAYTDNGTEDLMKYFYESDYVKQHVRSPGSLGGGLEQAALGLHHGSGR